MPSCREALDSVDARVRANYAGFVLEVRGARMRAYTRMLRSARERAARTPFQACFPVLEGLTRWFSDPHLFVYQAGTDDSAATRARRAGVERIALTEDEARAWLARQPRLDPIEGIWYDGPTRYAVVRDPGVRQGFRAILLTPDTAGWSPGSVRARFWRNHDGTYRTELLTRHFSLTQHRAHVHRRTLLRLDPGIWGKSFPLDAADRGYLASDDAHAPVARVRAQSVVIAIPSHDPRFRLHVDRALLQSAEDIRRTGLLIVDLRGNEGGGSLTTRALSPWIASSPGRVTPFDSGAPVMLASPAQASYARRAFGAETTAFVRSLVTRMAASPGRLVPLREVPVPTPRDSVLPGNWRVVLLVDHGTVSAAEVMVLQGLRSTRAIVVGEPTAGALDYQSVQVVGLGLADRRWALGYPTIAAHADLPRRGMRGRGISPDVRVRWSAVGDAYADMERRFGRGQAR